MSENLSLITNYDQLSEFFLLEGKGEPRNTEFKNGNAWEFLKYKITKALIGLSNLEYGGKVIVGINEDVNIPNRLVGMTEEQSKTYTRDEIMKFVNEYADPHLEIKLHIFPNNEGLDDNDIEILSSFPKTTFENQNPWMADTGIAEKLGKNIEDIFRHCKSISDKGLLKPVHQLTDNSTEYEITDEGKRKINEAKKYFVIINVLEFFELPTICKKDGNNGLLQRDKIYIRPRKNTETADNFSHHDMRELLDLATEKHYKKQMKIYEKFKKLSETTTTQFDKEVSDF